MTGPANNLHPSPFTLPPQQRQRQTARPAAALRQLSDVDDDHLQPERAQGLIYSNVTRVADDPPRAYGEHVAAVAKGLVLGDPDRWAVERQYLKNDVTAALEAFRTRRQESLAFLATLAPEQWARAGTHPARGRVTADDVVALMAWHDDNHLDQLTRALEGRA